MTRRIDLAAILAAFAAAVPFVLVATGTGPAGFDGQFHFAVVAVSAGVTALGALGLTLIGALRTDPRSVLVGIAFSTMAGVLALHGLATPGFITNGFGLVAFTAGATLPVGGMLLAVAGIDALRRPHRLNVLLGIQGGLLLAIALLGAIGFLFPDVIPSAPSAGSGIALVTLAGGIAFFAVVGRRAFRTYLLTRRGADLLVVVGLFWLTASLFAAMTTPIGTIGFWIGHALELAGIAAICAPVFADVRRTVPSRPLTGDLDPEQLVSQEEAFLGSHVHALMVRLARKDRSTELHTRAVSLLAVQIGEELRLPPARLRKLALGGLLHDLGKLQVPNRVLQKPSGLTEEEFAIIRCHPRWGDELLERLGGFPADVRRLVLDHHERLDGRGYPRGLTGDDLDLDTRILTVCDVYEALVSDRVYRAAWTPERALSLLREETGTAFDGRCVDALTRVLEQRHGGGAAPGVEPLAA